MTPGQSPMELGEAIAAAAAVMPDSHLGILADRIGNCVSPEQGWSVTREPPVREYMQQAASIVAAWNTQPEPLSGSALALALRAAMGTRSRLRAAQDVQLVWTGPDTAHVRTQLTSDVVIDVMSRAQKDLLLVSYANYPEPRVRSALVAAVDRGVNVSILAENAVAAEGQYEGPRDDPYEGLAVARYQWSPASRPRPNNRPAVMHAKLILADDHTVLISSANLTGRALDHNMEAGVLISGGPIPQTLYQHFRQLSYDGIIQKD